MTQLYLHVVESVVDFNELFKVGYEIAVKAIKAFIDCLQSTSRFQEEKNFQLSYGVLS